MGHTSYTQFRANLATYMDQVCADRAPLVVTRQGAEPVVMIAEAEWASLQETLHLLANPFNASRLARSVAALDAGEGVAFDPETSAIPAP